MTVDRVAIGRVSPTMGCSPPEREGHLWELTAGSERTLLLCGLEEDHAIHRDIHRGTIATEPSQYEPGPCSPADLRHSKSNQTALDIPTAYRIVKITAVSCQNIDRLASRRRVPRRRRFRKVADPTSESAGRPEEAPTDSSPRGRCLGTFLFPPTFGPHSPLAPTAITEAGTRRRAAAEQGTHARRGTADGRARQAERPVWVGPEDRIRASVCRRRVLAASRVLLRRPPQILRVKPARGEVILGGRPQTKSTKGSARGWPRGAGLTRAVEAAVGIPGWQLVKRYCGEIGSQGLRPRHRYTASCPPALRV